MSASIRAIATLSALTSLALLAGVAPAAASDVTRAGTLDAGSCGRLETQTRPATKLRLKVGKPGRIAVTFATERPCVLDVWVRPLGRDTGIVVSTGQYVRVETPATFTWTVTGTKKADDLLVASVRGGGAMFGVRLPDVSVR